MEGTDSPYSDGVNVPSGRPAVGLLRKLDASPNAYSRWPDDVRFRVLVRFPPVS